MLPLVALRFLSVFAVEMGRTRMKACLLFFVKYPEPGAVKTRLAKMIGYGYAVEFYKRFILDSVETLSTLPQQVNVCYAPGYSGSYFRNWLGERFLYTPQQGKDLGERMDHSFQQAFQQGFGKVAIIGSDLPDLPSQIVTQAFKELDTHDAVIGPAVDGGYYLLGFRQTSFFPSVFEDIAWSRETVFEQTSQKIEQAGLHRATLPIWQDVDSFSELRQLCTQSDRQRKQRARHTVRYWHEVKREIFTQSL